MPRVSSKTPKVRLNLDMSEATKRQLEVLRERTNADSMSEVVRRAIAVYDFLTEERQKGSVALIKPKGEDPIRLELR